MSKCRCKGKDYNAMVSESVCDSITALTSEPGAFSVIRNGGWEQWLRNILLIRLDSNHDVGFGFSEASYEDAQRIDVIVYCVKCKNPLFAIEIKTNFLKQPPAEIKGRISEAICQLDVFVRQNIPSYIVYALIYLHGKQDSSLVRAQNTERTPSYKHFDFSDKNPWLGNERSVYLLDYDPVVGEQASHQADTAEVKAWVALVQAVRNMPNLRRLTFLNNDSKPPADWSRRTRAQGRTKRNFWQHD